MIAARSIVGGDGVVIVSLSLLLSQRVVMIQKAKVSPKEGKKKPGGWIVTWIDTGINTRHQYINY